MTYISNIPKISLAKFAYCCFGMTYTKPKTERGHDWHVHATFEKHDATKPNLDSKWYEKPYGTLRMIWAMERTIPNYFMEQGSISFPAEQE